MADTNNNKPFKQYSRLGNASIELASWPNGGRNSATLKIASKLRIFSPTKDNPEPSAEFMNFKEYGQVEVYPTDVPNLLDLCAFLRDDMEITTTLKPRKVA